MILCGDIGGTNTRLRLTQSDQQPGAPVLEKEYASQEYPNFNTILKHFLETAGSVPPDILCLAIAGPVRNQACKVTNLPWTLDARELENGFGINRVHLMNDFEAVGYVVEALEQKYLHPLNTGQADPGGRQVVMGPGTGLGIAFRVSHDGRYQVYPTEGGHVDFAPRGREQIELLEYWRERQANVSVEHFLSGPGLVRIHSYVCNTGKFARNPELEKEMQDGDAAAAISHYALEHDDSAASHALNLFLDLLAAQAGNVALEYLATGGVYLAGGILPKVLARVDREKFMHIFCNKNNMENLLQQVPVNIITHPQPGLEGALYYARQLQDR